MKYLAYKVTDKYGQTKEYVRSFHTHDKMPVRRVWDINGYHIEARDCDYSEKYNIHRRFKILEVQQLVDSLT